MAAVTQSARLHPPSWDEEVVPALRKRLESESRTLAKRMSAASLASSSDGPPTPQHPSFGVAFTDPPIPELFAISSSPSPTNHAHSSLNTPTTPRQRHQYHPPSNRSMTSPSSQVDNPDTIKLNGYPASTPAASPAPTKAHSTSANTPNSSFQRSRAISQPYLADLPNGKTRPRAVPRPSDVKPTRIPKPSRHKLTASAGGANLPNPQHESPNRVYQNQLAHAASRSTISVPSAQNSGLLHETPPFPPSSAHGHGGVDDLSRSQSKQHRQQRHQQQQEPIAQPRKSNESEHLAYEHWYRGDASRNGGVGELRVGTRMEMLEIANYGYQFNKYSKRNSGSAKRQQAPYAVEDGRKRKGNEMMMMMSKQSSSTGSYSGSPSVSASLSMMSTSISTDLAAPGAQSLQRGGPWGHRPRADSIAGVGTKDREYEYERERESFYLDTDEDVIGGRVLDESPPTDLEGEGEFSDVASDSEAHYYYSEERREREFGGVGGATFNGRSFSSSHGQKQGLVQSPEPIEATVDDARSSISTPTVNTHRQRSSSSSRHTANTSHHQQTSSTATVAGANGNTSTINLPSRIPVPPGRKSTDTARSSTPTQSASKLSPEMPLPPLPAGPRATSPSSLRQNTVSPTGSTSAHQVPMPSTPMKRGATSPTPHPPSAAKSPRTAGKTSNAASKATRAKTEALRKEQAEEAKRREAAHYSFVPDDDDGMQDAIPVWTQPVVRGEGNWDDVILPVVARKKGMDGHFERTDGRRSASKKTEVRPEPAPGTFGFDHSKLRTKEDEADDINDIRMGEFGLRPTESPEGEDDSNKDHPIEAGSEEGQEPNPMTTTSHDEIPLPVSTPVHASERPPFSDYPPTADMGNGNANRMSQPQEETVMMVDLDQGKEKKSEDKYQEEEPAGGCCKCVIM